MLKFFISIASFMFKKLRVHLVARIRCDKLSYPILIHNLNYDEPADRISQSCHFILSYFLVKILSYGEGWVRNQQDMIKF